MKSKRLLLIIVLIGLLLAGLIAGLILVQRQQLLPRRAAIPTGTATIKLNPETKTVAAGTTFPVQIGFTTGGQPISAITGQLDYAYEGDEPPISVSTIQVNANLLSSGEWSVPIRTSTASNGQARIRIAAVNTSLGGYSSADETVLATIVFQANRPGTITVRFDATESKITMKANAQDTLLTPTSTGVYTVEGETVQPSPTPSEASGPSATPTPTTSPGSGPSATPTPTTVPAGESSPTPTPTTAQGGTALTCSSLDIPGGTSRSTGEQVRFVCNGSQASLVTQCRFRFGDGSSDVIDDDCNVFHTYDTTGSFNVSCEVRDTAGSYKGGAACANAMTIAAAAANTPTPPGGSTSTTVSGGETPESGVAWPTFLFAGLGVLFVAGGARLLFLR